MVNGLSIEARLAAVEARLEIGQLPIRYAMAVDARDIDAWVGLWEPDVDCGRRGRGREALRTILAPMVTSFYRSIHLVCGHRIELITDDTARGKTYCRAEHEIGDRYIVMGICYDDEYRRVDGEWFFSRRREQHWYAADVLERPQAVDFRGWEASGDPALPGVFNSWAAFWQDIDTTAITGKP
jgi:SnoaL-like domain